LRLQKHREVGGHVVSSDEPLAEYQYILDGQQRTTALLTSIYGGKIEGRGAFDPTLYVDLSVEVGDEPDDELCKRRFLFWSEIDDGGLTPHPNNARRKRYDEGLVVPLRAVKQSFSDVERALVRAGREDYDDPVRHRLREARE